MRYLDRKRKRQKDKRKRPFLRHKLDLYFDEDFPRSVVDTLRSVRRWKKRYTIRSAHDLRASQSDDRSHFHYCKQKGYILVTRDDDFMNDKKYPFGRLPGIIRVVERGSDPEKVGGALTVLLDFLSAFPLPRLFVGDSKFQVSRNQCIMRARDAQTRQVKTVTIRAGGSLAEVARAFHYWE